MKARGDRVPGVSLVGQLEPQQVSRDTESSGPLDQFVEVFDDRAVFDAAELGLGDADPSGDDFLSKHTAMKWMISVGENHRPYVPALKCVAQAGVLPEFRRHCGRAGH